MFTDYIRLTHTFLIRIVRSYINTFVNTFKNTFHKYVYKCLYKYEDKMGWVADMSTDYIHLSHTFLQRIIRIVLWIIIRILYQSVFIGEGLVIF